MAYKIGQSIRYLGPYDECAGHSAHPYGGKIATIVELKLTPPLPERPILLRFPDGFTITAAETEVRETAQAF